MKKIYIVLIILLLLPIINSCGGGSDSSSNNGEVLTWDTTSHDGSLKVTTILEEGKIYYMVDKHDVTVIEKSRLGLEVDVAFLTEGLSFLHKETKSFVTEYENITGKSSHVRVECNETTLTFVDFDFYLQIVMRAYNDGYAFRYKVLADDGTSGEMVISNELTTFNLPDKATTYTMPYTGSSEYFSYEEFYQKRPADKINGYTISMPALYQLDDNVWSLITEADLYGHQYIGSFLKGSYDGELVTIPALKAAQENTVNYPFTSPWRIGIVGTLNDIIRSELVEAVYDDVETWRPDNYDSLSEEEKAIYDYDWVESDFTAWNWLLHPGAQKDYKLHMKYIDLAADMGWGWHILDGGWVPGIGDQNDFREMVDHAKAKGIKLMAWGHALNDFGTLPLMRTTLDRWKSMGIDGIKIDFFDGQGSNFIQERGESQYILDLYEVFYQETAKRQMIVNCHGSNKPTGERRIYPHVINREGIRGNEFKAVSSAQVATVPFIRGVIGPSDFTPTLIPTSKGTTTASQIGFIILFESGLNSMAGKVEDYNNSIAKNFIKNIPSSWDEVKLIEGMPLDYCVLARRKGNDWFIAGTTTIARDVSIDLSFISEGRNYTTEIIEDGSDYLTIEKRSIDVDQKTILNISMLNNGGFAIRVKAN